MKLFRRKRSLADRVADYTATPIYRRGRIVGWMKAKKP